MAADRITRVSLVANVSNYVSGMNQAAAATRATGTAAERLAQQRQAFEGLGKGLLGIGAVATASVAISVKKFAEFDAAISKIQAATHASAETMGELRAAAIDAGAKTVYSATEAAGAIEELSKAGLTSKDILGGGLAGALNLAAAGGLEVADAAQQTAITLKQFGLAGNEASHVADLLSAGAGKAVGDVSDLSAALGQAGLVANQTGLSVEETTGVLAAFADKGLLGSDAGTSLKTMLQSLVPSSKQAADEFEKLGISAYDAQGNFVGIANFAGQYQTALKKLSPEQQAAASKIIFGSDAVRAANVLYTEGAAGIEKYIDQTNDSGYAAETARIKLDNLKGDLEQLGGAFDTALIQTGSGANGALRDATQSATYLVGAVGQLPQPLLAAGLATGALTAATALTGGTALLAVPKFAAFRASLAASNISLRTAAVRTAGAGVALGGLGIALGALVSYQAEFKAGTAELTDTLDKSTGAITKYTRSTVAKSLADKGVFAAAKEAGISQRELTDAVIEGGDAVDRIKEKFGKTNTFGGVFTGVSERSGFAQLNLSRLSDQVQQSQVDFKDLEKSGEDAAGSTGEVGATSAVAASQLAELSGAADTGANSLDDLKAAIEGFGSAQLDVDSATRDFQSAIDDMTSSVDKNGAALNKQKTNFDTGSEAGRSNQAALEGIASSTLKLSSATLTQTNSSEKAAAVISRGREAFIRAAEGAGISQAAARKYADQLGLIPKNVTTAVKATGVETAAQQVANLKAQLNSVPRSLTTVLNVERKESNTIAPYTPAAAAALGIKNKKAGGGRVSGPGTSTSDSIPALLSDGEYVIRASSVNRVGTAFLDSLNQGVVAKFASGGLASLTGADSSDRISFRSSVRSGSFDLGSGISTLYQMAQANDKYAANARVRFGAIANYSEVAMASLEKRSTLAAARVETLSDKVEKFKDASASTASSVSASVAKFNLGDYGSALGLKAGLGRATTGATEFAGLLKKLAKKGVAPAMVTEIASLGVDDGLYLARSLDQATAGDIKSINTSYKALGTIGDAAGKTVADANYGTLIASAEKQLKSADKNADKITRAINTRAKALERIIGRALGVKGYSAGGFTGAGSKFDVAGVVHAGEYVVNAAATANPRNRMMLESMNRDGFPGYASGGYANPVYVRGAGAGMDVSAVVAAIRSMPARQVIQNNDIRPIQNGDPQVITTTLGRELSRQMAGMV